MLELVVTQPTNIYEKPSFDSNTLISAPKSAKILQIQAVGDWIKVIYKDKAGYLHKEDVKILAKHIEPQKIINFAEQYLYYPYVKDAVGLQDSNFDSSSFVQWVFAHIGVNLPRTAHLQSIEGKIVARNELKQGDLLFFSDPKSIGQITQVGIFNEAGSFVTVTERNGVCYQNLYTGYWDEHFVKGKRIVSPEE